MNDIPVKELDPENVVGVAESALHATGVEAPFNKRDGILNGCFIGLVICRIDRPRMALDVVSSLRYFTRNQFIFAQIFLGKVRTDFAEASVSENGFFLSNELVTFPFGKSDIVFTKLLDCFAMIKKFLSLPFF